MDSTVLTAELSLASWMTSISTNVFFPNVMVTLGLERLVSQAQNGKRGEFSWGMRAEREGVVVMGVRVGKKENGIF